MNFKVVFVLFSLLTLVLTNSGCTKIEGPGGAASIQGKIHVKVYDGAENFMYEYDAHKYDVYIIYGNDENDTYFDDDIETSYDGTFKFEFLEKGNYRIFVYEDCNSAEASTCFSGKKVSIYEVEITGKKQVVDLGTIDVYKKF